MAGYQFNLKAIVVPKHQNCTYHTASREKSSWQYYSLLLINFFFEKSKIFENTVSKEDKQSSVKSFSTHNP
jgi:hypothetical protein